SSIDTVTRISDGSTYVFKGDYYWRVEANGIADGYPRRISTDWDGLPGNLDASLTWADGKTFFFKVGRASSEAPRWLTLESRSRATSTGVLRTCGWTRDIRS